MQTAATLAFLATTLGAAWRLATPLIFAATGEAICERSGVINIGVEGIMLMGAFAGFATTYATGGPCVWLWRGDGGRLPRGAALRCLHGHDQS